VVGGLNALHQVGFDFDPETNGFKGLRRKVKRVRSKELLGKKSPFLVAGNGFCDPQPAEAHKEVPHRF